MRARLVARHRAHRLRAEAAQRRPEVAKGSEAGADDDDGMPFGYNMADMAFDDGGGGGGLARVRFVARTFGMA